MDTTLPIPILQQQHIARPLTLEKLPLEIRLLIYKQLYDDEPIMVRWHNGDKDSWFQLHRRADVETPMSPRGLVTLPRLSRRFRDDVRYVTKDRSSLETALLWSRAKFFDIEKALAFAKACPETAKLIQAIMVHDTINSLSTNRNRDRAYNDAKSIVVQRREEISTAFPAISRIEYVVGWVPRHTKYAQIVVANLRLLSKGIIRGQDQRHIRVLFYRTWGPRFEGKSPPFDDTCKCKQHLP